MAVLIARHCSGVLLAALVLVHGLVAVPLFVECIDSHRRSLIEAAGHDACHDHSQGVEQERVRSLPAPSGLRYEKWRDHCLDLSLYKPAVSQSGFERHLRLGPEAPAISPAEPCALSWRAAAPEADPSWHSPPGPYRPASPSLRI